MRRTRLSRAACDRRCRTLAGWGIGSQRDAESAGIEWPDADNTGRFSDIWRWEDDVHEDWVTRIEDDYPALAKVIDTARTAYDEGTAAYLTYMSIRLIEMHRILKPTGSMYLHCDTTASHYLKSAMDAIFGADNFRNEIIWKRFNFHADAKRFGKVTDRMLFYAKSPEYRYSPQRIPYKDSYVKSHFRHVDDDGRRYRLDNLNPPGGRGPVYEFHGVTRAWRYKEENMRKLDAEGRIYATLGGVPQLKRYLDELPGEAVHEMWLDIPPINPRAKERTGYPTQKPVALAERIIKASSNPGDVVLDCFAGCAYVPVAAERNGRQWIACDISPRALTVLRRQFAKFNYAVDGTQQTETPLLNPEANITTKGPGELPPRADEDPVEPQSIKELPPRKFKVPASRIPEGEMMEFLLGLSGYTAWCCGYAVRRSGGEVVKTTRNFHLDHIDPKSKQGSNQIMNRAPLCPDHNIRKNNRRVHLEDYRAEISRRRRNAGGHDGRAN